jgi:hypothetical protein
MLVIAMNEITSRLGVRQSRPSVEVVRVTNSRRSALFSVTIVTEEKFSGRSGLCTVTLLRHVLTPLPRSSSPWNVCDE